VKRTTTKCIVLFAKTTTTLEGKFNVRHGRRPQKAPSDEWIASIRATGHCGPSAWEFGVESIGEVIVLETAILNIMTQPVSK
jgi:hypothetical protein